MATSIIFGVFAVPALVFARPDCTGCDYDYYVRYMADGRFKTFLGRSGTPYYNVFHDVFCFCISLSIVLTMAALVHAPKTAFSDALWVLWLLILLMRYAATSVFRTWHPAGARLALACVGLMCLLHVLAVVFTLIIGCVLISSSSISLAACFSVAPVLLGLCAEVTCDANIVHSVRANQHLYDATTTYTVTHDGADTTSASSSVVHDLNSIH